MVQIYQIINLKKLYLESCGDDIYVGLEINDKLLYVPQYVLYKFEPSYKPKRIKREI